MFTQADMKKEPIFLTSDTTQKRAKMIFLDLDGVLSLSEDHRFRALQRRLEAGNSDWLAAQTALTRNELNKAQVDCLDAVAVACLHQLIRCIIRAEFQPCIIISSDWRYGFSIQQLQDLFSVHLFSKYIVGKTEDNSSLRRGILIKNWLEQANASFEIVGYVILDDIDDQLSEHFKDQFVKCDYNKGFVQSDFERAMKVLGLGGPSLEVQRAIEREVESFHMRKDRWDLNWHIKRLEDQVDFFSFRQQDKKADDFSISIKEDAEAIIRWKKKLMTFLQNIKCQRIEFDMM